MTGVIACRFCKGEIEADARKCRHCGEWVKGRAPATRVRPQTSILGWGCLIAIGFVVAVAPRGGFPSLIEALKIPERRFVRGEPGERPLNTRPPAASFGAPSRPATVAPPWLRGGSS